MSTLRQRWRDAIRDSDDPQLDELTRLAAFALDRHMSADGRTHTGRRLLRTLMGVGSEATAASHVHRLIEAGWLIREWAGRGRIGHYRAVIPSEEVGHPIGHSEDGEVGHPIGHSQDGEVGHLVTESGPPGDQSGLRHSPDPVDPERDPETTDTQIKGRAGAEATTARSKGWDIRREIDRVGNRLSERSEAFGFDEDDLGVAFDEATEARGFRPDGKPMSKDTRHELKKARRVGPSNGSTARAAHRPSS